jgi:hypothetical protein
VKITRALVVTGLVLALAACTRSPPSVMPDDDKVEFDIALELDWRWVQSPSRACPSGLIRFEGWLEAGPGQPTQEIRTVTRTDVDGDGDLDYAFLVACGYERMVAAFTRAEQTYVPLGGPVVTTTRPVRALSEVERAPAGVRVRVADRCCVDRPNADFDVLGHLHVRSGDLMYPDVVVDHQFT